MKAESNNMDIDNRSNIGRYKSSDNRSAKIVLNNFTEPSVVSELAVIGIRI